MGKWSKNRVVPDEIYPDYKTDAVLHFSKAHWSLYTPLDTISRIDHGIRLRVPIVKRVSLCPV